MDSYLQPFERYAENEGWDPECFGTYLGSLLSGKALEVYSRLPAADARDYETLKEALLVQYQLTQEDYRKRFFSGVQSATETASQFLARLEHCFDHWVRLSKIEHSFEGLRELVLMEQFLRACPRDLALFARERSPRDLPHLLELAKVLALGSGPKAGIQAARNPSPRPEPRANPPSVPTPRRTYGNRPPGLCFTCRQPGHQAANCPSGKPRPYFENTAGPPGLPNPVRGNAAITVAHECSFHDGKAYLRCGCSLPVVGGGCTHGYQSIPLMTGRVGNHTVTLLRDTGCDGVVVKRDLVEQCQLTGDFQRLVLMNRSVLEVLVARISIDTPVYTGEVLALCMHDPICDLVIGNIPGVHREIMGTSGLPREEKSLAASAGDSHSCAVLTRAQAEKEREPVKPLHVSGYPTLSVNPREFREAQRKDDDLARYYEFVHQTDAQDEVRKWFALQDDTLFRFYRRPEDDVILRQAIVPTAYRAEVLRIGHEGLLAGHLGIKKTTDRIVTHFFWPGIFGDIRRFCQSCDICQRTVNRGTVKRAPVQNVPIVHLPFDKVAIDLIGPMSPVTNRGHRWILTLVDYATRYPEAVALCRIDTETIAEALLGMFSRVGFPKEILSDNGAQFVSRVMSEVSRLISVKQLFSSPYHPMANGLCEKFNGTLKKMLLRMCNEQPREWDRYIEPLLFAYREVPQESTGLSPFELLYGRAIRGPMTILRELWTKENANEEVTMTYQYVFDLRNRIEQTCNLAHDNLLSAQRRYKRHFDKKALLRVIEVGEKVLVMLPTDHNKLLLRWKGPYSIEDKVGLTDYRIKVGAKLRLFHVNMLKKYTEREPMTCAMTAILDCGDCPELDLEDEPVAEQKETHQDVVLAPELEGTHSAQLERFSPTFRESQPLTNMP